MTNSCGYWHNVDAETLGKQERRSDNIALKLIFVPTCQPAAANIL